MYLYDSLVRAFEEGLQRKASQRGERALTQEVRVVLAVRALDREVNNGGYHQFFSNSSCQYALTVVPALESIGCGEAAALTKRALDALNLSLIHI